MTKAAVYPLPVLSTDLPFALVGPSCLLQGPSSSSADGTLPARTETRNSTTRGGPEARSCRGRWPMTSVRQRKVERRGQAVGNGHSGQRRHQPPAALRAGAHDDAALVHEASDEGVICGQQVHTVARPQAVEIDPGRGAQAEKQRLRRQVLRTQELLRLDRTLARRESSLPARRASLVPPAAGRR